ncbi:ricin-type beta-trefoil lectin domain protein [Streptomyces sp. NPDC020681]|uniref:ricin-type beta-trefoil lectin domain protein n=1 Tax=Streptomyces sp. NPDC020681 TaxID=3365083 RepID=UPI0037BC75B6
MSDHLRAKSEKSKAPETILVSHESARPALWEQTLPWQNDNTSASRSTRRALLLVAVSLTVLGTVISLVVLSVGSGGEDAGVAAQKDPASRAVQPSASPTEQPSASPVERSSAPETEQPADPRTPQPSAPRTEQPTASQSERTSAHRTVVPRSTLPGHFLINALSNKCLAPLDGKQAAGVPLITARCDGLDARQRWTVNSDNTIRTLNQKLCMDVPWGTKKQGTFLQLSDCHNDGTAAQVFVRGTGKELRNPHAQQCAEIKNGRVEAGTWVWIMPCNNTARQQWNIT